jgi:acyl-CoA reductase-like NAD-dependent aldehyde dehydrogenase
MAADAHDIAADVRTSSVAVASSLPAARAASAHAPSPAGRSVDRPGFFGEPTVLDRVSPAMPVVAEEAFGPAVPILRAADANAAIRLANDSSFGLVNVHTVVVERPGGPGGERSTIE